MEQIPAKLAEMDEFICGAPALIAPRIRHALLQDWQARCTGGLLPSRGQFAPEQLRYILANLILWDVQHEPLIATYRLYGSNLASRRGGEMTGKRLNELPDPEMRKMALLGLRRVISERQPLLSRGRYGRPGDAMISTETLSLPLAGDGRTIDMILHGQFNDHLGYDERRSGAGTVVIHCEPADALLAHVRDARLARLLQDWNAWRAGRGLPSRSDFGPEMLDYLLGNLFLFDIVPPTAGEAMPRFRYRLFGSSIAGFRGFDLTGRHIDEHPDGTFAARGQLAYAQAVARRQPLWAKVDGIGSTGQLSRFEALVLPLAGDGETPDMVLAAQIMAQT